MKDLTKIKKIYNYILKYKKKIKFVITILLFLIFYKFINQSNLIDEILNLDYNYLILAALLFLLIPLLNTYRWYFIVKDIINLPFNKFYENITIGFAMNTFTFSSMAIDLTKFTHILKYTDKKKAFILVVTDKLLSLYFKIIFLYFALNFYNFSKLNFYFYFFLFLSTIFFIVLFYLDKILLQLFKIKILEQFIQKSYFSFLKKVLFIIRSYYLQLFLSNICLQILSIIGYLLIARSMKIFNQNIEIIILTPIVETITQLQLFFAGLRELSTVMLFNLTDINYEQSFLMALLFTLLTLISTIITNIYITFKQT